MRDISILHVNNGYINSINVAPPGEMPGKYRGKDVFKIQGIPDGVPVTRVLDMFKHTIFGTTRRVIPYSEFRYNRLIVR